MKILLLLFQNLQLESQTNELRTNKRNQTVNDGVAHSKNPRKCAYHVTFDEP